MDESVINLRVESGCMLYIRATVCFQFIKLQPLFPVLTSGLSSRRECIMQPGANAISFTGNTVEQGVHGFSGGEKEDVPAAAGRPMIMPGRQKKRAPGCCAIEYFYPRMDTVSTGIMPEAYRMHERFDQIPVGFSPVSHLLIPEVEFETEVAGQHSPGCDCTRKTGPCRGIAASKCLS